MSGINATAGKVVYVTPGVFTDGGGWEIVVVNGKLEIKPVPPWDGWPILWSAVLLADGLERFAAITDKTQLKPQLFSAKKAIVTAYAAEIKNMTTKLVPQGKFPDKDLCFIYLNRFGFDGSLTGITAGGQIVHTSGWTPEFLVPFIGALDQLAEITNKKELKPELKMVAKAILEAYKPELTHVFEQKRMEEFANV
jgi:hypothetical protein